LLGDYVHLADRRIEVRCDREMQARVLARKPWYAMSVYWASSSFNSVGRRRAASPRECWSMVRTKSGN
jgi:hypothetical protein